MAPEQFAYWLMGYAEITNGQCPNAAQWQIIRDHLSEVFVKVTPDRRPVTVTTAGVPTRPFDAFDAMCHGSSHGESTLIC